MTDYYLKLTASEIDEALDGEIALHAATHKSGGTDSLKLSDLAVADDVTTKNATTGHPGLSPKLSGVATEFYNGVGEFTTPAGGSGATITLPGSSSVFYNGTGGFSIPAASGSVFKPGKYIGMTGSGADYICDGVADQVQINQALSDATDGTTIYILPGDYGITSRIFSQYKCLNIIGIGDVTITKMVSPSTANGIYIEGKILTSSLALTANAAKGDYNITVSSASAIQAGDLIKLSNTTQWCAKDYADQFCGETYCVKSVSGNTITLTENILRAYTTAATSTIIAYRPIEVHIENIKIIDYDSTTTHEGIALRYCINSSVSDCWIKNSGLSAISIYSSYNVKVYRNHVYNSAMAGSGYGVGIWSGTAHAEIYSNHLENCRHCVTCNTDERNTLMRNIFIHHNTLIPSATNDSSFGVDTHNQVIDIIVTNNIFPLPYGAHGAFWDGSFNSVFANNYIYGGYLGHVASAVERRGSVNGGIHIIKDNYMDGGSWAYLYRSGYFPENENIEITGNVLNGGGYGVYFEDDTYRGEEFASLLINNNQFKNLYYNAINIIINQANCDITIKNNYIKTVRLDGITITATNNTVSSGDNIHSASTQATQAIVVSNNDIVDANTTNTSMTGIRINDILKAVIQNNHIRDTHSYGGSAIVTTGATDYCVLTGNTTEGMTGTHVVLAGAHDQIANFIM